MLSEKHFIFFLKSCVNKYLNLILNFSLGHGTEEIKMNAFTMH